MTHYRDLWSLHSALFYHVRPKLRVLTPLILDLGPVLFLLAISSLLYRIPYLILSFTPLLVGGAFWILLESSLGFSLPLRNLWLLDNARRGSRIFFLGTILLTTVIVSTLPEATASRICATLFLPILLVCFLFHTTQEKIAENKALKQGFASKDGHWRICVENEPKEGTYFISFGEKRTSIQPEEAALIYRLARRTSGTDQRVLERVLWSIHLRRFGFKRGPWTILPTSRPRIYIMYKGDHESSYMIADRDVSWIAENHINQPEHVLEQAKKLKRRISLLRRETLSLRNVFYAGNYAVIEVDNITVQIDLHNGKVYRIHARDEWGEERENYICIRPLFEGRKNTGRVILGADTRVPMLSVMGWDEAVILSKILSIAQEVSPANDLIVSRQILR
jgi:hypothetical protein